MKAELKDTINDMVIQAWFTDKLPGSFGPLRDSVVCRALFWHWTSMMMMSNIIGTKI